MECNGKSIDNFSRRQTELKANCEKDYNNRREASNEIDDEVRPKKQHKIEPGWHGDEDPTSHYCFSL
jgi:hypothetical protein